MLASSSFELRRLLYKVRAYLARYPHDADGEMLREQIEKALKYEVRAAPTPPIGARAREAPAPFVRRALRAGCALLFIILIISLFIRLLIVISRNRGRPPEPGKQAPSKDAQRPDGLGTNFLQGSGDLYDLLGRAIREFSRTTKTDYNQIFLIHNDDHSQRLVCVADSAPGHKQRYRVAAFRGLLGRAYTSGWTINAQNVHDRPEYVEAVAETQSELIVPIKQDGRVIGLLNSESEKLDDYSNDVAAASERLSSALAELLGKYGWTADKPIDELPWVHYSPPNLTPDSSGKPPE